MLHRAENYIWNEIKEHDAESKFTAKDAKIDMHNLVDNRVLINVSECQNYVHDV